MGLFSKRRNQGFDPELWSDAADRAEQPGGGSWLADLGDDDPALDELEANAGAQFVEDDADWLNDDPGETVRRDRS